MVDVTPSKSISDFPNLGTVSGTEVIPVDTLYGTKTLTIDQISNYTQNGFATRVTEKNEIQLLNTSVTAGAAAPFEVSQLIGPYVGTGSNGIPGEYALVVSGFLGHTAYITIGSDGKIASGRIDDRGISLTNTPPVYALPAGTGLTGAILPTPVVTALINGSVFYAPSSDGTQKLGWTISGGLIAAWLVGGIQYSEYFKTGVDSQSVKADTYGSSRNNFNLWTDSELEYYSSGGTYPWGATNFSVIMNNGGLRIQNPATATEFSTSVSQYIPISALFSGKLSVSVLITSKPAGALGDQIFRLYGRDANGVAVTNTTMFGTIDDYGNPNDESGSGRWSRRVPAAPITRPTEIIICQSLDIAALVAAGVAFIEIRLRTLTTAQIAFSHITVRNGSDPHWVPTRVSPKTVSDNSASITTNTQRINARLQYSWSKNLITDPYFASSGATVNAPAWTNSLNVVSKSGLACVEIPANGSTASNKRWLTFLDVSSIPAGTPISISVTIAEKAGTTDTNTRLRIYAFDSVGTEVPIGGTSLPGNDLITDTISYNRYIPNAAISLPTSVIVWEGILLPAGIARLAFDVRHQNNPAIYLTGFVARVGNDAAGQPPSSGSSSGSQVIYLSPSGSDSNSGSASSPFATLQAAINSLGGQGTIIISPGTYTSNQRFNPSSVVGKIRIIGARGTYPNYDGYPVINMGTKLTGITKVGGYTKVYKASLTGLSVTNSTYAWIWQDGVADPRTVIANADRSPQHRGRTNRLKNSAKIIKTTATTISAACSEIDAGSHPLGFVDDATGDFYFSIVGGGDATVANIYVDAVTGLVNGTTGLSGRELYGELEIQGLEIRYGGITLTPFDRAHLDEVVCVGARGNAVDYSILSVGTLETAGAGSMAADTGTGDGLNGHFGAKLIWCHDLYTHDNLDDGMSDHEGCSSRISGGLGEYNGGTCLAPAYGADHIACNFVSRANQQVPGRKPAAFAVIGTPAGTPTYNDDGYDTLALWQNCISIGDTRGFADGGSPQSKAQAIDCKVYDLRGDDPGSVNRGYDGTIELRDCSFSSSLGVAKGPSVVTRNSTIVS